MLDADTMHFFRDELEKQAILTPASALKAMNYSKPGMFGNAVRKAGQLGARAQQFGAAATPAVQRISDSAMYGPGTMAGSVKGEISNAALRKMKASPGARRVLTGESRGSPLETTFNPIDVGNLLPSF